MRPSARILSNESRFDLICANLPYIPTKKLQTLPIYGREPTLALDGGNDGLDLFRRLLAFPQNNLRPADACYSKSKPLVDRQHCLWLMTPSMKQKFIFTRTSPHNRIVYWKSNCSKNNSMKTEIIAANC